MPEGTFWHVNIASTPQKSAECIIGWIAHYMIGMMFAALFITAVGSAWLQHPTPMPAIIFGIITVVAPFFILQPSFGLGLAASKTPNPTQARLRSLMNHLGFGVGLYLSAFLISGLSQQSANML
jgi:hypothetical protein